ncbi:hypothetical protein [Brevibacillus fortis]|nr:hypothetical protein [Brevibacillus fortis]
MEKIVDETLLDNDDDIRMYEGQPFTRTGYVNYPNGVIFGSE